MVTKEQLDEYTRAYSNGTPIISDEEYDMLMEEYVKANGEEARPFFRSKKTGDLNELTATLPKVYGTVTPWRPNQTTYSDWIRKKNIGNISIIAQPKFDGCSVALDMNSGRFFTRGDYDNGESVDVTSLFENYDINSLNLHDGISAVKFEAIMSHEVYDQINQNKYKRPRDVVSATITSQNVEMAKYITLVPLREYLNGNEILPRSLVDISMKTTAHNYDKIDGFISDKLADGARVKFNGMTYSIDGVVVSVVDGDTYTGEEVAIKILNNIKETKIINIEYQNGKTGKITPVGILEPIKFDDITVDHVGLANLSRVVELGLKYNDTVRIVYNIVPYLIDSYHDGNVNIPIPTKCPICGAKLNLLTLKTVRCTNPHCTGLKIGMIHRYCEQMKMMGLSKGILTKLFENNLIDSIPDLYKLTPEIIQTIDGFKEKSSHNIVDTIASASQDVPLSRWLGASPIKDVSAKTWQIIINHTFGMDEMTASNVVKHELEHGSPESFMENVVGSYVHGVGSQTFRLIHVGLTTYWEDIRETAKYVTFRITTDLTKPTKGRVTLTGTRDEQLTSYLVEHGYEVDDYSSKTIALVIPNESFISNKVVKARSKGIPIYTIEKAYRELQ